MPDDAGEIEVYSNPAKVIYGVVYSADSQRLLEFGTGGAWLYDVHGSFLQHYALDAPNQAAFSPDQKHLVLCDEPGFCDASIWDLKTGYLSQYLEHGSIYYISIQSVYLPDGLHLATIGAVSDTDSLLIWDAATGRVQAQLGFPQNSLTTLAVSPDGRLAAVGQRDGTIALVDLVSLKVVARLVEPLGAVSHLAFSRDGRYLASAGQDGVVRIWAVSPTVTADAPGAAK